MPAWKKRPDKMDAVFARGWHSHEWSPRETSIAFVSKADEEKARRIIFSELWKPPFPRGSNPFYIRDDGDTKLGLSDLIGALKKIGHPLGVRVRLSGDTVELNISEHEYNLNIQPQIPTLRK